MLLFSLFLKLLSYLRLHNFRMHLILCTLCFVFESLNMPTFKSDFLEYGSSFGRVPLLTSSITYIGDDIGKRMQVFWVRATAATIT